MERRRARVLLLPALVILPSLMNGSESRTQTCGCPMPNPPVGVYGTFRQDIAIVTIYWQDQSNNEGGFDVTRRLPGGQQWEYVCTVGANVQSCDDLNVYRGGFWVDYAVVTYDTCGYISYLDCPNTWVETSVYWGP